MCGGAARARRALIFLLQILDQMFMGKLPPVIKRGHLLLVHSLVNFLRMLTMNYLKRMGKKMR
ncbi:hypothetical protein Godav_000074 [Gossypium davidsonii]|uniref:Uncharacterized protein n=2 Tax=Gossypium TaxID=3633 RepID=A0A7J8T6S9_GOSDV|nr:hypothetical protein [Gossypium davidsonii]